MPRLQTVRFVGRARPRTAPLGAAWVDTEAADAVAIQLAEDGPAAEAAVHVPWIPPPSISACRCFPGRSFASTKGP